MTMTFILGLIIYLLSEKNIFKNFHADSWQPLKKVALSQHGNYKTSRQMQSFIYYCICMFNPVKNRKLNLIKTRLSLIFCSDGLNAIKAKTGKKKNK